MTEWLSILVKSVVGFFLVSVFLIGILLIYVWFLIAHYSAITQSFELLGYDQKSLSDNRLFGVVFQALGLGNATQTELFSGFITLAMSLSVMMTCFLFSRVVALLKDRAIFLQIGDLESARNIALKIRWEILPWLVVATATAIIIATWDVKLFVLRAAAGSMRVEAPEDAFLLKKFDIIIKDFGDRLPIDVLNFSRYGYLASLFIVSFLVDFLFMKLRDRWDLLLDAISAFLGPENPNSEQEVPAVENPTVRQNQNPEDVHDEYNTEGAITQHPQGIEMDEEVEIIGRNGKHIRRSEALTNPNLYYIDQEGRIWDREYYNGLHHKEEKR